jgi:hypothetical protein
MNEGDEGIIEKRCWRKKGVGAEQMIADPGDRSGGKSELHRAGWSLTATGGNPKESATENIPPLRFKRGKGEKAR